MVIRYLKLLDFSKVVQAVYYKSIRLSMFLRDQEGVDPEYNIRIKPTILRSISSISFLTTCCR